MWYGSWAQLQVREVRKDLSNFCNYNLYLGETCLKTRWGVSFQLNVHSCGLCGTDSTSSWTLHLHMHLYWRHWALLKQTYHQTYRRILILSSCILEAWALFIVPFKETAFSYSCSRMLPFFLHVLGFTGFLYVESIPRIAPLHQGHENYVAFVHFYQKLVSESCNMGCYILLLMLN